MSLPSRQTITGALLARGYQALTTVAAPLVGVALVASPRGRIRLAERFGAWPHLEDPVSWWFHGASVGEVQGIVPLLKRLREQRPEESTLLSCTSPTGLERARGCVTYDRILPLDTPWCVKRAFRNTPVKKALVLTETELWPELLREARSRGVRCCIVNGRISDYTLGWYLRIRSLLHPLLAEMTSICVPDELQRERFIRLGADAGSIFVTGHTKYDGEVASIGSDERLGLRRSFFPVGGDSAAVVTLGSVRPGEETVWLQGLAMVTAQGKRVKMIVAPRHAEKFDYFWQAVTKTGLRARRWSTFSETPQEARTAEFDVLLLDTMGVLSTAYAASDLAFIGATLVDIGGHNPMEAVVHGVPTSVGPYTSVISTVVDDLSTAGGVIRLKSEHDVAPLMLRVGDSDPELKAIGQRGYAVLQRHRGAVDRVLSVL